MSLCSIIIIIHYYYGNIPPRYVLLYATEGTIGNYPGSWKYIKNISRPHAWLNNVESFKLHNLRHTFLKSCIPSKVVEQVATVIHSDPSHSSQTKSWEVIELISFLLVVMKPYWFYLIICFSICLLWSTELVNPVIILLIIV